MRLSKRTIAVSTASLLVAGGISAFAWVSAGGSGTGYAVTVSETNNVTLHALTYSALPLSPSDSSTTLSVSTDNDNGFSVGAKKITVEVLSVSVNNTDVTSTCKPQFVTEDISPTNPATQVEIVNGNNKTLGAHDGGTIRWDEAAATDDCLGANVTVDLTIDNN